MRYALTARQVAEAEERPLARGLTVDALMARAGRLVAEHAARLAPDGRLVVVTGAGNNGGDGWVAATLLRDAGRDVEVAAFAAPESLSGDAGHAASRAVAAGVPWGIPDSAVSLGRTLRGAALIVDCLFGFGFHGAAREPYASAIEVMNDADSVLLAVDVPSGVDATTGVVRGPAVDADLTLTFSAPKTGLLLYPGAAHAGVVEVADIGLDPSDLSAEGMLELWDADDLRSMLPMPPPDAHKGSRGRLLVVGGSPGLTGAVRLAAEGAMRMGAGYVTVGLPAGLMPAVEQTLVAAVKAPLPETDGHALSVEAVARVLELAERADAVVLGPGLGLAEQTVAAVLELIARLPVPLLLDADALNAVAATDASRAVGERRAPTLLTPHAAELARLLGTSTEDVQSDRLTNGRALASDRVAVVLKGARTIVSGRGRQAVNLSGNAGLATAGTGDVLAGMCGALLAGRLPAFEAGVLGAYLHGRAGDLAAEALTELCVTAEDVPAYLPAAVKTLIGR